MIEQIKQAGVKYITYPLYLKMKGWKDRKLFFQECLDMEKNSYENNLRMQRKKLYALVDYAIKNVPYWERYANENKISISESRIFEEIRQFPIMTKNFIEKNEKELISREELTCIKNYSGGSTGEPVCIYQDMRLQVCSATNYFMHLGGCDIGHKIVKLWGSEKDILGERVSGLSKIAGNYVHRCKILNTFRVKEDEYKIYADRINRYKPSVVYGYVQSLYDMAVYCKWNDIAVWSPEFVMTTAGTLYDGWRQTIEDVFKCKVLNQYGSREVSGIACECMEQDGLHVQMNTQYIEIVDEEGKRLPEGQAGKIVITNLINRKMPLIRYEIGDIGTLGKRLCKCGRETSILQNVKGRTVNIFKTTTGEHIDGEYFTHLFYGLDWVRRFQVIQEDMDHLQINIEKRDSTTGSMDKKIECDLEDMKRKILAVMPDIRITYRFLEEIRPSASGKYIYTISKV